MQNVRQRVLAQRSHQNVNMVWHHDEMTEPVTLPVEKSQRIFNNCGNLRLPQPAFSHAFVEPAMKSLGEQLRIFFFLLRRARFGMLAQPFAEFNLPLNQLFLRNGICQSEGDEISAAVLMPMRQVTSRFPNWRI